MYLINGTLSASLPFRLRLPDGRTRTSLHELSEAELAELGVYPVDEVKPPLEWTQHYGAPEITVADGRATATYPVVDYSPDEVAGILEAARERKVAQIADARWREETAPYLWEAKGVHFDTSERSQIKYLQAAQKGKTILWKTYDGWVEMASGDFVDLITAYETYVEGLFTREATLAAQVQAAETVEAVEAIEW